MNLRILAVEDKSEHYDNLVSILEAISKNDRREWGIDNLLFAHAMTSSEAETLLEEAAALQNPYHVLILDLGIPKYSGLIPSTDNGFDILNLAGKIGAARQIMIYTNFSEGVNVLKALRGGASEFVDKQLDPGADDYDLQTRFMGCWQRVLASESANLLEQRVKDLIPYAEAGLAHRFTACFSDFVQTVAHTAEDIKHYAYERFGIDSEKDSQDYLIRCLKKQEAELRRAQDNWAGLKADLLSGDETPRTETIETFIDSIQEKLSPCLLIKNTSFRRHISASAIETEVLTFQDDVRVVLQEIITGTLSDLSDYGGKHTIEVAVQRKSGQAEIRFSDDLTDQEQRISPEDAQAINGGFSVGPNHGSKRFGRTWGLSVAQHIALRGGGRLIVKPQVGMQGNLITYFVPLAQ
jgi:DNA-binding NarL/FixJ family response regulator